MTDPHQSWQRLAAAARLAPDDRPVEAPPGFATRVAALAMDGDPPAGPLLLRLSLRAMGVACLVALVAAAFNFKVITLLFDERAAPTIDDPVAELLDLGS